MMLTRMIILVMLALLIPIPAYAQDLGSQLLEAAKGGQTEKVKALLEAGADVEAKDNDGETVLMVAAVGGYTDVVRTLLEAGADVNVLTTSV